MSVFLGIDTSNYTTSAALCREGRVLTARKLPVFVKSGERGVRQSDAVFSHIKNLPSVMESVGPCSPAAIGVSARPRDIDGSYMPCFLAGEAVASSLASVFGVPLYRFSHQAGHVRAALYSAGRADLLSSRFLALHVSGGTTEILLCEGGRIACLGGTLDLNAGQLIDRVGVLLGLPFPCGPALEALSDFDALKNHTDLAPSHSVRGLACNLSGLENKAKSLLEKGREKEAVAAFVIASVEKTLEKLIENALEQTGPLPVLLSGGVAGNRFIQKAIGQKFDAYFAEPAFSSDNAAGTALLCEERYWEEHDGG